MPWVDPFLHEFAYKQRDHTFTLYTFKTPLYSLQIMCHMCRDFASSLSWVSYVVSHNVHTVVHTFYILKSRPTFDLVSQLATLVLWVVDDWRRGGRSEAILLHLAPVPLLPGQHALATLPLVEVVSGLSEVHVKTARVFFVCAGA